MPCPPTISCRTSPRQGGNFLSRPLADGTPLPGLLQYDDAGRVQSLSMESAMEGDGSVISTTLHFTAASGLPAADSAFATANGCMQVCVRFTWLTQLQIVLVVIASNFTRAWDAGNFFYRFRANCLSVC